MSPIPGYPTHQRNFINSSSRYAARLREARTDATVEALIIPVGKVLSQLLSRNPEHLSGGYQHLRVSRRAAMHAAVAATFLKLELTWESGNNNVLQVGARVTKFELNA